MRNKYGEHNRCREIEYSIKSFGAEAIITKQIWINLTSNGKSYDVAMGANEKQREHDGCWDDKGSVDRWCEGVNAMEEGVEPEKI